MTIGMITTYHGTEHRYLNGYQVRIVAVLKNGNNPDIDLDGSEYYEIKHDADLERVGGVTHLDRIEVQPWIEKEGRFSFVTSDPKAEDLAFFRGMK